MKGNLKSNDNYITLPRAIYSQFREFMEKNYNALPGVADGTLFNNGTVNNIDKFPTFDIRVSGILFHLSPHQYFISFDPTVNEYFLGITQSDKVCAYVLVEDRM